VLAKQAAHLTEEERDLVLHDNVAELYGVSA
jgi:predicted TIM-barrel fold metal-dependent hydrolase